MSVTLDTAGAALEASPRLQLHLAKPLLDPWLITRDGMQRVLAVASRGALFQEVLGPAREEWKNRPRIEEPGETVDGTGGTLRIVNGIGLLSVRGTLFRHANLMMDFSGGSSYDAIWSGLEAALAAPDVRAILLRVASPGGEAEGCGELGDFVRRAREKKPTWSYIEGMGCSAAFWLPSQTGKIIAFRQAQVGSIGAIQQFFDDSKADENNGLKVHELVSRSAPNKRSRPLDNEVLARCQQRLDDLEDIFVQAVADGLGVTTEKVYSDFGQGDYMIASKALAAGMIHGLGDLNSTMAELRAEVDKLARPMPVRPISQRAALAAAPTPPPVASPRATTQTTKERTMKRMNGAAAAAEGEDMPATAEQKDCPDCKGSGKVDGEDCATCKGSGKVDKEVKAESDKPNLPHEEPDGDEAHARAELAAMVGLSAGASLRSIAATAQARLVPLSEVATVKAENARLSERLGKLETKEHTSAAEAFVDRAIADGRTMKDKRGHLVAEFVKAERAKEGGGAAALEPMLYGKGTFTLGRVLTSGGRPIGKPEQPTDVSQEAVGDIEREYSEKASAIAARDKITFAAALQKMPTEHAELHAKLRAARATGRR